MSAITITVAGNLTGDPELRFTPNGVAAATFTVAVNERRRNGAGEWEDGPTSFVRVQCWRDMAEHVCESLTRGSRVVVTGAWREREWTTESGEKRRAWELTADDVGASMRHATVKIARANRDSSPAESQGQGQGKQQRRPGADYPEDPPF